MRGEEKRERRCVDICHVASTPVGVDEAQQSGVPSSLIVTASSSATLCRNEGRGDERGERREERREERGEERRVGRGENTDRQLSACEERRESNSWLPACSQPGAHRGKHVRSEAIRPILLEGILHLLHGLLPHSKGSTAVSM